MMTAVLPGRAEVCSRLDRDVQRWRQGHGAIIVLRGEAGMGKTSVLDWMATAIGDEAVRVDCRPPIGSFNVSGIQPLQPFGYAIEQLYVQSEQAAKKRLAMNIGMSLLASIPIAGDIFYAVKSVSQDLSEYKRDTSALQHKKRAAVDECVATLTRIVAQRPVALLVDDAHWCDSQSVDVLRHLLPRIADLPLLIVWAVDTASSRRVNLPLQSMMQESVFQDSLVGLPSLSADAVRDLVRSMVPNAAFTEREWTLLHDRTAGTPGIVREYIRYLQQTSQVASDGTLADGALETPGLSRSDHPATDVALHSVSADDAAVLTLAAAEGREFTAFMVAALMNQDVLTAIRTLRGVTQRTGMIKSLGMRTRYGVKTTVYTFTQTAAYTHFLHYAEYEERKHLHQRIGEILSREYASAELDEVRQHLASFIAAHSMEADDTDTVERMLHVSAEGADDMGANDISTYIRTTLLSDYAQASLQAAVPAASNVADAEVSAGTSAGTPVQTLIRAIADAIIGGDALTASTLATAAIASSPQLLASERVTLLSLAARASIELSLWAEAEARIDEAERIADISQRDRCLLLNLRATLALRQNDAAHARALLYEASRIAAALPVNTRIVTLGNIILTLRELGDTSVERYERSLRRLVSVRGWSGMRADLAV
ncbi:MAG: hypothetical protein FGM24_04920 [Candidatus Kapabacteria bacterium]|nr:hypothetical protein [Candidatus Kapabacteria bacterium]